MTKRSDAPRKVDVLPPGEQHDKNGMQALDLPMSAPDMSIRRVLANRLKFWGYRRTLEAYRAAVASGVDLTKSLSSLYEAKRELEMERQRWADVDTYREAASSEADTFLREVRTRYLAAEAEEEEARKRLSEAKVERERSEQRAAGLRVLKIIEENEWASELAASEKKRLDAERTLEDARYGDGKSSYRERRRELEQRRKDYEDLLAEKQSDIERFGGEDKLPHWLQTFYDQVEDDFGFGEK